MGSQQIQIRKRKRSGWYHVDNEILTTYAPILKPQGIAVYSVLCMHADNKSQVCWPSISTIAREAGCSPSTARRAIKVLVREGLVLKESVRSKWGDYAHNRYTLLSLKRDAHLETSPPNGGRQKQGPDPSPRREEDQVRETFSHAGVLSERQGVPSEGEGGAVRENAELDSWNYTHGIWKTVLKELSPQMTRATYDQWLRDSSLLELDEDHARIRVRDAYAVEWCSNRLIIPIRRTICGVIDRTVDVSFCTDENNE